jgi:branched-chain amino acid transport system substrate-binding protein
MVLQNTAVQRRWPLCSRAKSPHAGARCGHPWLPLFLLACATLLLTAACSREAEKPPPPATIRIGAIYPFTGHSASAGKDIRAAIDLAAEIINRPHNLPLPLAGGTGLSAYGNTPIEIIYKDSRGEEALAGDLVKELVSEEGVIAVIGCYNSAVTAAASEQSEVLEIPFLAPDSTSPVLTQRGLKWFFRTTPDDRMFAENFFSFFADLQKVDRFAVASRLVLVYENRLWGTSVARAERKLAIRHGYEIAADIPYDAKDNSFEAELSLVAGALPAIVLQSSYANDAIAFMQGYRQRQIAPMAIVAMDAGFISPSFLESLGPDGEFILSREVWALDIARQKPLVAAVNDLFVGKYQRNMNGNSARAFTGLMVLADAINRAGSLAPQQVRQAIRKTRLEGGQLIMPWDGVRFDPQTGQNLLGKGIIVQVQKGKYKTVWPWELAQTPLVWPFPAWSETDARGRQ